MRAKLLISCLFATVLIGCVSVDTNAYKTIASLEATVDKAMTAWGDYLAWWPQQKGYDPSIAATQSKNVYDYYTNYRKAVNLVYNAREAYVKSQSAADKNIYQSAVGNAVTIGGILVDGINSYLPDNRKTAPKTSP